MRQKLKYARKREKLTQAETAKKLGISARYYQHIEAGTREGKGRLWNNLETLFKIPQRELRETTTEQL